MGKFPISDATIRLSSESGLPKAYAKDFLGGYPRNCGKSLTETTNRFDLTLAAYEEPLMAHLGHRHRIALRAEDSRQEEIHSSGKVRSIAARRTSQRADTCKLTQRANWFIRFFLTGQSLRTIANHCEQVRVTAGSV